MVTAALALISSAPAISFDDDNVRNLETVALLSKEISTVSFKLLILPLSLTLFKSRLAVSSATVLALAVFSTVFSLLESPVFLFSSLLFKASVFAESSSVFDSVLLLTVFNLLFSVTDAEGITVLSSFSLDKF